MIINESELQRYVGADEDSRDYLVREYQRS
jgi:hypothetical protein